MASGDKKTNRDSTAGKRKYVTLISQRRELIRRLKCGKSQLWLHNNTGSSAVYDIKEQDDHLQSSVASSVKCEGSFQVTDTEVP